MANKKLRGDDLDQKLIRELEIMINQGSKLAPISRPALQKRLGLLSRGTLATKERIELIENAKIQQFKKEGLSVNGKKKRNSIYEQNEILKLKIIDLEQQRDNLIETIAMIANGLQAKGLNVDDFMLPLRIK
ncbi:MAG: hypothetical protein RLZZ175_1494 [Bacteroidota bacterium]|jgi:hypothetical protein